jgi:hypothetical protein
LGVVQTVLEYLNPAFDVPFLSAFKDVEVLERRAFHWINQSTFAPLQLEADCRLFWPCSTSKFGSAGTTVAMSQQAREYIWKVARPKNEAIARAVMYAAYQTAIQTDQSSTRVLIR